MATKENLWTKMEIINELLKIYFVFQINSFLDLDYIVDDTLAKLFLSFSIQNAFGYLIRVISILDSTCAP